MIELSHLTRTAIAQLNQKFRNEEIEIVIQQDSAELLEKKIWLPSIPVWVLKIIFGELSLTLTTGSSVSAKKLLDTGFKFNYTNLRSAIHKELNQ